MGAGRRHKKQHSRPTQIDATNALHKTSHDNRFQKHNHLPSTRDAEEHSRPWTPLHLQHSPCPIRSLPYPPSPPDYAKSLFCCCHQSPSLSIYTQSSKPQTTTTRPTSGCLPNFGEHWRLRKVFHETKSMFSQRRGVRCRKHSWLHRRSFRFPPAGP